MKRPGDKAHGSAWTTAQMPRLVHGMVLPDAPVAPARKQMEADLLREAVAAHLARGGRYELLRGYKAPNKPVNQ